MQRYEQLSVCCTSTWYHICIFFTTSKACPLHFPTSSHMQFDFNSPISEQSCMVGVCCIDARAKIDSKLQGLLRKPHCTEWPQNNTQTYTHRVTYKCEIHSMLSYLCSPFSLLKWWPGRAFRNVPADSPALKLCAWEGNSESDSQMLVWLWPHLCLPRLAYRLLKVFIWLFINFLAVVWLLFSSL